MWQMKITVFWKVKAKQMATRDQTGDGWYTHGNYRGNRVLSIIMATIMAALCYPVGHFVFPLTKVYRPLL